MTYFTRDSLYTVQQYNNTVQVLFCCVFCSVWWCTQVVVIVVLRQFRGRIWLAWQVRLFYMAWATIFCFCLGASVSTVREEHTYVQCTVMSSDSRKKLSCQTGKWGRLKGFVRAVNMEQTVQYICLFKNDGDLMAGPSFWNNNYTQHFLAIRTLLQAQLKSAEFWPTWTLVLGGGYSTFVLIKPFKRPHFPFWQESLLRLFDDEALIELTSNILYCTVRLRAPPVLYVVRKWFES